MVLRFMQIGCADTLARFGIFGWGLLPGVGKLARTMTGYGMARRAGRDAGMVQIWPGRLGWNDKHSKRVRTKEVMRMHRRAPPHLLKPTSSRMHRRFPLIAPILSFLYSQIVQTDMASADCSAFPDVHQTASLPPLWALPTGASLQPGVRACTAAPEEYMKACCMTDIGAVATTSACDWTVCFTTANDTQLEACFRAVDRQVRGDVAEEGAGWLFNCTQPKAGGVVTITGTGASAALQSEPRKSGAARVVVGWVVVSGALAVLCWAS